MPEDHGNPSHNANNEAENIPAWKKWRLENPERDRENRRRWQEKNREERREQARKRYQDNPEKFLAKARSARKNNPEYFRARDKKYHLLYAEKQKIQWKNWVTVNREEYLARRRALYAANAEKERQKAKEWRDSHPEKTKEMYKKWKQSHPEKVRSHRYMREARKLGAAICDLSAAQWREIQEHYKHRCYYCGKRCKGKLTQDHIQPLSKGGGHTASNIVPACRSCNSKKHVGPPLVPVQPLLLTLAAASKTFRP